MASLSKLHQFPEMLAMHDMFPSHGEIPAEVWIERFGLAAILSILVAFLRIPRSYKIAAGIVLPLVAYVSAQVYWGTVF